MNGIKQYEDKTGYRIFATDKAYKMYYRKLGFKPVEMSDECAADVSVDAGSGSGFSEMKVADLKQYLTDRGITFSARAKREELKAMAEALTNGSAAASPTDAGAENMGDADPDASDLKQG